MSEIVLHHYWPSLFSEKVRIAFGIKGLDWCSVEIPNIAPKPDLVPLSGGYRRTPVMQIGADVYCDTQCILRELERRHPEPTLYPNASEGPATALSMWTDRPFFQAAVGVIFGEIGDQVPQEFMDDRSKLMGRPFDVEAMRRAAPALRDQLLAHAAWLDRCLEDGRDFLFGSRPGLADCAAYHVCWFVRNFDHCRPLLERFAHLSRWVERMAAIGHGSRRDIDAEEALRMARESEPESRSEGIDERLEGTALGLGRPVTVIPDDYGRGNPVTGTLEHATLDETALRRNHERVGEVVVHFPRVGYLAFPSATD